MNKLDKVRTYFLQIKSASNVLLLMTMLLAPTVPWSKDKCRILPLELNSTMVITSSITSLKFARLRNYKISLLKQLQSNFRTLRPLLGTMNL